MGNVYRDTSKSDTRDTSKSEVRDTSKSDTRDTSKSNTRDTSKSDIVDIKADSTKNIDMSKLSLEELFGLREELDKQLKKTMEKR